MAWGTWGAALLVLASGCGVPTHQVVKSDAAAPPRAIRTTLTTPQGKCCVPRPEPSLKVAVYPSSGPPGTKVRLVITGCGRAARTDDATVSFNNDALNTSARNDPNTVRNLGVHRGTRIALSYKIAPGDRTGGLGQFFVQCGQTLIESPFNVTG